MNIIEKEYFYFTHFRSHVQGDLNLGCLRFLPGKLLRKLLEFLKISNNIYTVFKNYCYKKP